MNRLHGIKFKSREREPVPEVKYRPPDCWTARKKRATTWIQGPISHRTRFRLSVSHIREKRLQGERVTHTYRYISNKSDVVGRSL